MIFELTDHTADITSEQTVVVIDDEFTSRVILGEIVQSIHEDIGVVVFADPVNGLKWLRSNQPDLVIIDYRMDAMSGHDLLQHIRRTSHLENIPVVVVTVAEARDIRYQLLEDGATDFILKPIDTYECRVRFRNLLALRMHQKAAVNRTVMLENAVARATEKIVQREHETLFRLAKAGEYRDTETGNHIVRMAKFSRLIAESMGLSEERCELIERAAPMHDIGKIGIPDNILLKPGRLDPAEFIIMKRHTEIGYEMLCDSPSQFLSLGAIIALGHHEKFDGSGYPYGLTGKKIPLEARIVAVADVYDALTSTRPYKKAWSNSEALEYLCANRGTHFDPSCLDAFIKQYSKVSLIQQQLQDFPEAQSPQAHQT